MHQCSRCKQTKPLSEFRKDKQKRTGLHPWCKACCCEHERIKRQAKPLEERNPLLKCRQCKRLLPRGEFIKRIAKHPSTRMAGMLCTVCRATQEEREAQYRLNYAKENVEQLRTRSRIFRNKNKYKVAERWENIKAEIILDMGGECQKCGLKLSNDSPAFCFDFHHIDPSKKEVQISTVIRKSATATRGATKAKLSEQLKKELNKCAVLCALCHRKIHKELFNACNRDLR